MSFLRVAVLLVLTSLSIPASAGVGDRLCDIDHQCGPLDAQCKVRTAACITCAQAGAAAAGVDFNNPSDHAGCINCVMGHGANYPDCPNKWCKAGPAQANALGTAAWACATQFPGLLPF